MQGLGRPLARVDGAHGAQVQMSPSSVGTLGKPETQGERPANSDSKLGFGAGEFEFGRIAAKCLYCKGLAVTRRTGAEANSDSELGLPLT